jgi:hypothetical protein
MTKFLYLTAFCLTLSSCGTYTPIPSHGGGKRFSVEQSLVTASMRRAINDIPVAQFVDAKVNLELVVMPDSGGGYTNGGRASATQLASSVTQHISGNTTNTTGFSAAASEPSYVKDLLVNQTDSRQFQSLLISSLLRNNVLINPTDAEGKAEYLLEVFVDVLGTWKSRTDWFLTNSERLTATTSLEYVITNLGSKDKSQRLYGRVSYDATYEEKYTLWMGPVATDITVAKSDLLERIQPAPTAGTYNVNHLLRESTAKPTQPEQNETPVIYSPTPRK